MLSRRIKRTAISKGLRPGKYIFYLVGLWIGMEICGSIIGALAGMPTFGILLLAIIGGIIGAVIAFQIVNNAKTEEINDYQLRGIKEESNYEKDQPE